MASSLDITPSKGHGLVTAQNMPGGYDAIDDRRQWGIGRQEGATTALAYKVTERAEGANLSVDIATNQGHFLVQGDDEDWQDLYLVPATALKANLDLADPPDISNPRVDRVVLEAHDDIYYGNDGSTRGRLYVLSGIPTSGANVVDSAAYNASKAALPPSTACLAEFVVPANATSIASAAIRDRRTKALGAFSTKRRTSGDTSSAATTPTSIFPSDLETTLEIISGLVRVHFSGVVEFGASTQTTAVFTPLVNGASFSTDFDRWLANGASTATAGMGRRAVDLTWELEMSPGRYTFGLGFRVTPAVSVTFKGGTGGAPAPSLTVEEIVGRQNATN